MNKPVQVNCFIRRFFVAVRLFQGLKRAIETTSRKIIAADGNSNMTFSVFMHWHLPMAVNRFKVSLFWLSSASLFCRWVCDELELQYIFDSGQHSTWSINCSNCTTQSSVTHGKRGKKNVRGIIQSSAINVPKRDELVQRLPKIMDQLVVWD